MNAFSGYLDGTYIGETCCRDLCSKGVTKKEITNHVTYGL